MKKRYETTLNRLSAIRVARLDKPGLHADGGGLGLQIAPQGARSWVFRYMLNSRARRMGLGPYPAVSLATARVLATKYRTLAKQKIDPMTARAAERLANKPAQAEQTFDDCARALIELKTPEWKSRKHLQQWTNTLRTYASATLGHLPVAMIDTELVLAVLAPIWISKNETATRVRGRIEAILDWTRVKKYRSGDNPARWHGHLEYLLACPSKIAAVKHYPALPFIQMKSLFKALQRRNGMSATALEFTILTAARTSETLYATPIEFDLPNRIWTIPAERMKGGRMHRIPLTERACEIATRLIEIERTEKSGFLFRSRTPGKPLSNMAMLTALRTLTSEHYTVHGFRSSFRDWAAECTEFPNEIVEMALAHKITNLSEAAYRRGDLLGRRVPLMIAWERYCLGEQR